MYVKNSIISSRKICSRMNIFFIVFIFLFYVKLSAQSQYSQKMLVYEDGLHQKSINTIAFNDQGFAFIGTNIGFSVFNGSSFFNYYESSEFKGRIIEQILPMDSGSALLGENTGVYLFQENRIKRLKLPSGKEIEFTPSLFKSESGEYFVTVHGSVYLFKNNHLIDFIPKHRNSDFLKSKYITSYYKIEDLEYFKCYDTIYVYNGSDFKLLSLDIEPRSITKIGKSIFISNQLNKSVKVNRYKIEKLSHLDGIKINSFVEIDSNEIMAVGESLVIFDSIGIKERIAVQPNVSLKLNKASVDHEKNIWIATYEGLLKVYKSDFIKFNLNPQRKKYTSAFHYFTDIEHPNWVFRIMDTDVIGTCLSKSDSIFRSKSYLTKLKDLEFIYSFEQLDTNEFLVSSLKGVWQISPTKFIEIKTPTGLRITGSNFIKKFGKNELYIISDNEGVLQIKNAKTYPISMSGFSTTSIGITLNGTKIYGGANQGLFCLKNDKEFPILPDILPMTWALDITIMKDSTIWVYYYWEGFAVLKEVNGEFQLVNSYFNQFEELGKDLISFVNIEPNVMAIFSEIGLTLLNHEGKINNFPPAIFDYNPTNPSIVFVVPMLSGDVCVAFDDKLTIIPKKSINKSWMKIKEVTAYVSEISTLDSVYFITPTYNTIKSFIRFPSNTTFFKVQLNALYFSSPEKIRYRYRLENREAWITIGKKGEILFSNLPYGEYKLIFQASMDNLNWGQEQNVSFIILTPWYRQYWFYALIGFLFILIVGFLLKARINNIKQILNIKIEKAELYAAKTKSELMALQTQMNPHLLLNSLSLIQGDILDKDNLSAAERIANLGSFLTQTLQNSTDEFITLKDEVLFINSYIGLYDNFISKRWEFDIIINENLDLKIVTLPAMMIQPLVENAIKHGLMNSTNHRNYLIITINPVGESLLHVQILDSGPGLDKGYKSDNYQNRSSIGNQNVKKRLEIYLSNYNVDRDISFERIYDELLEMNFSNFSFFLPFNKLNSPS